VYMIVRMFGDSRYCGCCSSCSGSGRCRFNRDFRLDHGGKGKKKQKPASLPIPDIKLRAWADRGLGYPR